LKTKSGHISIAELREQMDGSTIVANTSYQRAAGIWPNSAKSYFIDTIINDYPFQSVYIHEYVSKSTKRIKKDIVDGQQRLTTIFEYLNDEFALGTSMKSYPGRKFSQLDEDVQDSILAYAIPVITISQSDTNEILEMFRRMNAFMVPLNPAEKRHSEFGGAFKWFINNLADDFSPMLNEYGTLTEKQIVRMADTELITDFADIVDRGIQNRQPAAFSKLYKKNDDGFANEPVFFEKIGGALSYIRANFSQINGTYANRSYVIYSLVAALIHNRWGIPEGEGNKTGFEPVGYFSTNPQKAIKNILTLASAHEGKDETGPFKDYVNGCLSTTHRVGQRLARTRWLIRALRDEM
jgi:Protein of unknown function DUF262